MLPARVIALLSVMAAGAVASGCGAAAKTSSVKDFKGDQRAVAQTVQDLSDHSSDEERLCRETLSSTFVRAIIAHGKDSCPTALKRSLRDTDSSTNHLDVKAVTVEGAKASARVVSKVTGGDDRTQTLSLVREGRPARWKISGVSG